MQVKKKEKKLISIIIPVYNEEKVILFTVKKIIRELQKRSFHYEIIIVNDGSNDDTLKIIKKLESEKIKILDFPINKGKGHAVKEGMIRAKGDVCLYTDADYSTPIGHFFKFLPYLKKYDVVIASRRLPESVIIKEQSFCKALAGKGSNFLIRKLLFLNYSDTQCGFKLFTNKVAKKIFPEIQCLRWGFDFELLKIAEFNNLRVKEMPVVWKHNPQTKVKFLDYFKTLIELNAVKRKYCSKNKEAALQLSKFFLVGGMNTFIDFLVLNLLLLIFGIGSTLSYSFFKAVSFLFSCSNSFFWNKKWVFKKNDTPRKKIAREVFSFFSIAFAGLIINTFLATLFFSIIPEIFPQLSGIFHANLGALVGSVAVAFFNFFGFKYFVFKK